MKSADANSSLFTLYRNGQDITNPRNWYCLLSEKTSCKNGIYGYNHPDDNSYLPQLAQELDLSYDFTRSPHAGGSTFRRSSISKSSSAYQYDSPIKRQFKSLMDLSPRKESTLVSFCKKEESAKKKTNRVTFVDTPDYKRSVSFPKLRIVKTTGVIPETSIIENENLAHSHKENLEEWFSQMPDETTTKAKRKLMEQNIQETIQRKGTRSNAPLPKASKSVQENFENFPACYKELRSENSEEPILINRDIYKLQIKSMLKLHCGDPTILDKLDFKKREYIVVSPRNNSAPRQADELDEEYQDSVPESSLGFNLDECPLFIVSTKRAVPLEMESTQSFKHGIMPQQKKLKRLKNIFGKSRKCKSTSYTDLSDSSTSGKTLLSLGETQFNPLTRQPKHITEKMKQQQLIVKESFVGLSSTPTIEVSDVVPPSSAVKPDLKRLALLAKYKPLEVFSENRQSLYSEAGEAEIVEVSKRKEIPRLYYPVFKMDRNCDSPYFEIPNNDENAKFKTMEDLIPLRIQNGVAVVGSAKSAKSGRLSRLAESGK